MADESGSSEKGEKPQKAKARRQTQACDACRSRKVKCDRSVPDDSRVGMASPSKCGPCRALGIQCTFSYTQKKRGPQIKYLQRLAENPESDLPGPSNEHDSDGSGISAVMSTRARSSPYPPNPARQEVSTPYITTTSYYRSTNVPGTADHGTLAEQHAMHAHALERQGIPLGSFKSIDVERDWEPHLLMTLEATKPGGRAYLPDLSGGFADATADRERESMSAPATLAEAGPSRSNIDSAHSVEQNTIMKTVRRAKSLLDSAMPRWRLLRIMELFVDHISPITPSVDQDVLMSDLREERDAREGEAEWCGMVLAIAAQTLAQLPACFVPLSKDDARHLLDKCRQAATLSVAGEADRPSLERVVTLGHLAWTSYIMGKTSTAKAHLGAAWAIALDLRLHDRKAIQTLEPAKASMRRRTFWLLSTLDRTLVTVERIYPIIPSDICVDPYQEAIEDAYDKAVNEGIGEEPPDEPKGELSQTLNNRLFSIIASVKTWSHRDEMRWEPPSQDESNRGVDEASTAFHETAKVIDDWSWFGMGNPHSTRRGTTRDLEEQLTEVKHLFTDPNFVSNVLKRPEMIHKIQFVLTLAAARSALHQHLDKVLAPLSGVELLSIVNRNTGTLSRTDLAPELKSTAMAKIESDKPSWPDTVARSVAGVLMETPMQVICLNHPTLVPLLQTITETVLQYPLVDSTSTFVASTEAREKLGG